MSLKHSSNNNKRIEPSRSLVRRANAPQAAALGAPETQNFGPILLLSFFLSD
jgi:cobyric acid synthase